jgi:hypothetical protein
MPAKRQRTSDNSNDMADQAETNGTNGAHFIAPADVNDDPDRVKFAYWVPNVSGGLVISKIPQKTKYDPSLIRSSSIVLTRSDGTTSPM